MAKLYIEEYGTGIRDRNGYTVDVPADVIATHELTVNSDSTAVISTTDFNNRTRFLVMWADGPIKFKLETSSTATVAQTDRLIPGGFFRTVAREDRYTRIAILENA